MILVGEIGGTKAEWCLVDQGDKSFSTTPGFNIARGEIESFLYQIEESYSSVLPKLNSIHLYLAGFLGFNEKSEQLVDFLKSRNPSVEVELSSDKIGAARALAGDQPAWIGILGTGAGFFHFDGKKIDNEVSSLGCLIGDEGSGIYIGRAFLKDVLRNNLPSGIEDAFASEFKLTHDEIIAKVYSDQGLAFISQMPKFLSKDISDSYCYGLIEGAFESFFNTFVLPHQISDPIFFSGGIASAFEPLLKEGFQKKGFSISKIVKKPIEYLAVYHLKV